MSGGVEFSDIISRIDAMRYELRQDLTEIRKELKEDMQRTRHDIRDEMGGRISMVELKVDKADRDLEEVKQKQDENAGRDKIVMWGGALGISAFVNWLVKIMAV